MPSATDAAAEAFSDLLTVHGESLSFRGGKVVALVNRNLKPDKIPNEVKVDFHSASQVSIPVETAYGNGNVAITATPDTGEYFRDAFGFRHRIEHVQFLGSCYLCTCFVSKVK